MDHLPIFTKMTGKHCLLVGGGSVAARKLETLLDAGAQVTLVALDISDAITAQQRSAITILQENYSASMLGGKDLVIAATDDRQLNATISQDASTHHLFVNVVDNPELCSFIMPSIIDRSPITIAISTSGKAPVLARLLRGKIESFLLFSYGKLAQLADKYREQVKAALPTGIEKKNFWERVFEGSIAEHVFTGNDNAADQELQALLQQAQD